MKVALALAVYVLTLVAACGAMVMVMLNANERECPRCGSNRTASQKKGSPAMQCFGCGFEWKR